MVADVSALSVGIVGKGTYSVENAIHVLSVAKENSHQAGMKLDRSGGIKHLRPP